MRGLSVPPNLIAVAGPLSGTAFPLTGTDFSIGREPSNRLWLNDPQISRNHCVVRTESGEFRISDLGSRNCTFVNGVPVKDQVLHDGDSIAIASHRFVFVLQDAERPRAVPDTVQLDDVDWVAQTTVTLPIQDVHYLPTKLQEPPTAARAARDLDVLLKVGTLVNSSPSLDALQRSLLQAIFEVVPAEHAAILLVGNSPDEFASLVGWSRLEGSAGPIGVSRTIVGRVLREGIAILANDLLENPVLGGARSLVVARIESVLCVPLVAFEKVLGAIYLDAREPGARFEDADLRLLAAIAAVSALAVKNVTHLEQLQDENQRLREDDHVRHDIVGGSPQILRIHERIAKLAPTDSTVLIRGESGTGKELVARAIHRGSPRASRPFAAINCAALTETLLESELFGHEKGAFTGAIAQKKGKLEAADGGTVFLDEIGELAPALQTKLLRVLQEHEFERVGGTRPVKVDLRLLAATNRDLEEAIGSGSFRKDLYYRLNVVTLTMPALRERREDIPLLAGYFIARHSERAKRRVIGLSVEARTCLLAYDWPGNVRELENAIERAVVLGSTDLILPEDLPEAVLETLPPGLPSRNYYEAVKEAKKQLILKALEESGGGYTEAAKLLGMGVNYLHRLIKNLDLKPILKKGTAS
jgi:transcriptional regulator with GAF, ATPase, and Fis domain